MCGGNVDLFFLTNPVSSGLGLQVILRVPIRVKNDHRIRRGQINAETTRSRGQQEAEILQSHRDNFIHTQRQIQADKHNIITFFKTNPFAIELKFNYED